MARWKSNLQILIAQKSAREQRTITKSEIMREAGVAMRTVDKYMEGSLSKIEAQAVEKLCNYLGCEYSDLIDLERLSARTAVA